MNGTIYIMFKLMEFLFYLCVKRKVFSTN